MVAQRVMSEREYRDQPGWRPSLALEQRAGVELAELIASPIYYGLGVPRGDGRSVLLIPGFMGSDGYLTIMAGWLRRIGYRPVQSGITVNAGSLRRLLNQVERRAEQAAAGGQRLTLIGHSLGGVFARVLAVARPDLVEDVITLGSPLMGNPRESAHPLVRALGEILILDSHQEEEETLGLLAAPLPAGTRLTSIYSKEDAVVQWRACMDSDPQSTCVEVRGTHIGLAWNASVYRRTGHILAS